MKKDLLIVKETAFHIHYINDDNDDYIISNDVPSCMYGDCFIKTDNFNGLSGNLQTLSGQLICYNKKIDKFEKCPSAVYDLRCYNNNLKTLAGSPTNISGYVDCSNNELTALGNSIEYIEGYFNCSNCKLTTFGENKIISCGQFNCSDNELTSLANSPQIINGNFNCSNNKLKNLIGGPHTVEGSFSCYHNDLTSLVGALSCITKNVHAHGNNLTFSQIQAYSEYLLNPTSDHTDSTGHYIP